jgi:hypothetical protein
MFTVLLVREVINTEDSKGIAKSHEGLEGKDENKEPSNGHLLGDVMESTFLVPVESAVGSGSSSLKWQGLPAKKE